MFSAAGSNRKRAKLNFDDCAIKLAPISRNLIQIQADEDEMTRRLNCFVERKREEINVHNVEDFIEPGGDEFSCARTRSTVYQTNDSRTHLRGLFSNFVV